MFCCPEVLVGFFHSSVALQGSQEPPDLGAQSAQLQGLLGPGARGGAGLQGDLQPRRGPHRPGGAGAGALRQHRGPGGAQVDHGLQMLEVKRISFYYKPQ